VEAAPAYDLERLIVERSLSVNTTAAGGNTHLMTLGTETGI
jgi:delta 1-pyrroline-5-carboxylate dehydrogenase